MGKNENAAQNSTKSKVVGIIDGILGVMFLIGAWTQVAAIILAIDLVVRIVKKAMSGKLLTDGVNYYLILLVLCISLIVTSAGWLALDLGV